MKTFVQQWPLLYVVVFLKSYKLNKAKQGVVKQNIIYLLLCSRTRFKELEHVQNKAGGLFVAFPLA